MIIYIYLFLLILFDFIQLIFVNWWWKLCFLLIFFKILFCIMNFFQNSSTYPCIKNLWVWISKLTKCIYLKCFFSLYFLNIIMNEWNIMKLDNFKWYVQILKEIYSYIWKIIIEILNYLPNLKDIKKKRKLNSETQTSETREPVD